MPVAVLALLALAACGHGSADPAGQSLLGYTVSKATNAPRVYRNPAHGYQLTFPAGIELQEHRNGHYVIVPEHGSLFGIWTHAEDPTAHVEGKLLQSFERWCGEHAESARERSRHGGSLRLVPITREPFRGYKAVARDLPDNAPARFYAFRSPRQDGYFGFNLTPALAGELLATLQPLAPAEPPPRYMRGRDPERAPSAGECFRVDKRTRYSCLQFAACPGSRMAV